jgi:NAD(P)-dependent dehydrogenase (short-subunit alcohol dehydrogenase family)
MEPFRDRVALVTGAASGIGRAVALALAGQGARVAALDIQAKGLEALAGELTGRPLATAVADVTDLAGTRAAVADLEAQLGPTDLLLAAAGVGRETSAINFRAEDVAAMIAANLVGVANTIDAVLPGMRERGAGHLAAVSSLASYRGLPRMAGYCASKAGVNALLDALRVELLPLGIAVTTICPGWVRTPMTAGLPIPASAMMDVGEAARRIVAALAARRSFVAFPARLAWQVWLLRHLPRGLSDNIVRRKAGRVLCK